MEDILVYPNPFSDKVFVKVKHQVSGSLMMEWCNASGQLIMGISRNEEDTTSSPIIEVNTAFLSPGVYYLKFNNGQQIISRKPVKME